MSCRPAPAWGPARSKQHEARRAESQFIGRCFDAGWGCKRKIGMGLAGCFRVATPAASRAPKPTTPMAQWAARFAGRPAADSTPVRQGNKVWQPIAPPKAIAAQATADSESSPNVVQPRPLPAGQKRPRWGVARKEASAYLSLCSASVVPDARILVDYPPFHALPGLKCVTACGTVRLRRCGGCGPGAVGGA